MNYIKIIINNKEILIDLDKKIKVCNEKISSIDSDLILILMRILQSFENDNYNNKKVIDGDKYFVRIVNGLDTYEYSDKLNYPDNYYEFKKWVDDVYE